MDYKIISDGSCDLPPELAAKYQIDIVPFYVSFDKTTYKKEGIEMNVRDFYQTMVDHPKTYPTSSLPSIEDYLKAFTPYVQQNIPIICICITTKFSGSYNSANNAKNILLENYKNAKISVIDATINTVLQGQFVLEAARMQQDNLPYNTVIETLERIKSTGRIFFTIGNMEYLKAGGRIGKLTGFAADKLGIKPLILLKEGEIFPIGLTRNREKGKIKLLEEVKEHFSSIKARPEDYSLAVGYGYDYQEAVAFRDQFLTSLATYSSITSVPIYQIGATIGVHTGPFPIGIGLIQKYNTPLSIKNL